MSLTSARTDEGVDRAYLGTDGARYPPLGGGADAFLARSEGAFPPTRRGSARSLPSAIRVLARVAGVDAQPDDTGTALDGRAGRRHGPRDAHVRHVPACAPHAAPRVNDAARPTSSASSLEVPVTSSPRPSGPRRPPPLTDAGPPAGQLGGGGRPCLAIPTVFPPPRFDCALRTRTLRRPPAGDDAAIGRVFVSRSGLPVTSMDDTGTAAEVCQRAVAAGTVVLAGTGLDGAVADCLVQRGDRDRPRSRRRPAATRPRSRPGRVDPSRHPHSLVDLARWGATSGALTGKVGIAADAGLEAVVKAALPAMRAAGVDIGAGEVCRRRRSRRRAGRLRRGPGLLGRRRRRHALRPAGGSAVPMGHPGADGQRRRPVRHLGRRGRRHRRVVPTGVRRFAGLHVVARPLVRRATARRRPRPGAAVGRPTTPA